MQSAFNIAALYTSLADITAAEPVTGIVLGIVVFGTASPYRRVHPARSLRVDRPSCRRDLGGQVPGSLAAAPIPPAPV
jgi:hypothetical protein